MIKNNKYYVYKNDNIFEVRDRKTRNTIFKTTNKVFARKMVKKANKL